MLQFTCVKIVATSKLLKSRYLSHKIDLPKLAPKPLATRCPFCSTVIGSQTTCCSNCSRVYCSKDCMVADWKESHKFWCGKSGELNHDFSVKDAGGGKGLGVFANRDFKVGERVFVDRYFQFSKDDLYAGNMDKKLSGNVLQAVMELSPYEEELQDCLPPGCTSKTMITHKGEDVEIAASDYPLLMKIGRNMFGDTDHADIGSDSVGCFGINGSRFNHACVPVANCGFDADVTNRLRHFVAVKNIAKGEEITLAYSNDSGEELQRRFPRTRGFACKCKGCQNTELRALDSMRWNLEQRFKLDVLTDSEKYAMALQLMRVYEALQLNQLQAGSMYTLLGTAFPTKAAVNFVWVCWSRWLKIKEHLLGREAPQLKEYQDFIGAIEKFVPPNLVRQENEAFDILGRVNCGMPFAVLTLCMQP